MISAQMNIAELCNGSTADSDSVCWGSNPYSAARKNDKFRLVVFSIKSASCGINPPVVDEIALR